MASLTQNLDQNHGPDQGRGGKTTHNCHNRLFPPETRGSRSQKTIGDAGPNPVLEREEKRKDHHPRVLGKLQTLVFHPLKTQNK